MYIYIYIHMYIHIGGLPDLLQQLRGELRLSAERHMQDQMEDIVELCHLYPCPCPRQFVEQICITNSAAGSL